MYLRALSDKLQAYLTPQRTMFLIILMGACQILTFGLILTTTDDAVRLGGDFTAFWVAGREVFLGEMAGLYTADGLPTAIATHRPELADIGAGLTWQYPPHSTLIFSPFGTLPFFPAYLLWTLLGLGAFGLAIKQIGLSNKWTLAILFSPFIAIALLTGQNGLFTAAFLIWSITLIKSRPVLAGLAAAALTVKPQLGLLLPIAYIAGRAWLPFFTAALASLALWGSSVLIAGKDSWIAFFDSVQTVNSAIDIGMMPLYKMVTVYAASNLAGLPQQAASLISLGAAALVVLVVAHIWRRTDDLHLRLASVSALTLIIAPYGFFYELTLAVPAMLIVGWRGYKNGWLPMELPALIVIYAASLFLPGPEIRSGISYSFVHMLCLASLTVRRILHDLPQHSAGRTHTLSPLRETSSP